MKQKKLQYLEKDYPLTHPVILISQLVSKQFHIIFLSLNIVK